MHSLHASRYAWQTSAALRSMSHPKTGMKGTPNSLVISRAANSSEHHPLQQEPTVTPCSEGVKRDEGTTTRLKISSRACSGLTVAATSRFRFGAFLRRDIGSNRRVDERTGRCSCYSSEAVHTVLDQVRACDTDRPCLRRAHAKVKIPTLLHACSAGHVVTT